MDYASEGKLYVIATPIGHLEDVTIRALEVLKEVDLILSEDTRETDKLLKKYDIEKSQIPYNDNSHEKNVDFILEQLASDKSMALISDSGTPLISDPGFKLVRRLRKENFEVISIPGPSSPIAALSISGLPTDNFVFLGFLPKSRSKRENVLKKVKDLESTIIIFVSPHSINKQIKEFFKILGNRSVFVAKDLTKKFENVTWGDLKAVSQKDLKEKGEYIVIIAKKGFSTSG